MYYFFLHVTSGDHEYFEMPQFIIRLGENSWLQIDCCKQLQCSSICRQPKVCIVQTFVFGKIVKGVNINMSDPYLWLNIEYEYNCYINHRYNHVNFNKRRILNISLQCAFHWEHFIDNYFMTSLWFGSVLISCHFFINILQIRGKGGVRTLQPSL